MNLPTKLRPLAWSLLLAVIAVPSLPAAQREEVVALGEGRRVTIAVPAG